MSIASRQVKKETNRIIEERMKEGLIPSVEYIAARLGEFYAKVIPGQPSFQARHQAYRKLWNIDIYNSNISELYDDINNLYEELIDQFTVVLQDFDYHDTARHQLLHRIKTLESTLQDLVLVAADTEGYVYSVHDSFIDRSKVDLRYSTCEINTDAGTAMLRESMSGVTRVDMSHYYNTTNFPILAESKFANNIISNTIFPLSRFGSAFSDTGSSWIQNILSNKSGELQVGFIVDISPTVQDGIYITRIEISGQSPKPMYIQPLYSIDNINFIALPMGFGAGLKEVFPNQTTIWNFDEIRARYVKFIIVKMIEDEQVSSDNMPAFRYVVGFKSIKFYKMGYDSTSVLYSTAFQVEDPTGEAMTIDKASLTVDQDLQTGTTIDYFLSLGTTGVDDPTQFNWAPISATNDPSPTEQQIVDFKHVAFFDNVPEIPWDEGSYGTPLETYQEIDFYKVYQFPYEPVKNSVKLFRGKDNWQVTPKYTIERKSVYDEKCKFGSTPTITLNYPNFTPVAGDGLIRGSAKVKSDAGQSPVYWHTTPGDWTINYTTKVISRVQAGAISLDPDAPSNTVYVDYQYDNEVALPTVYSTNVYVGNPDGIDIAHIPFSAAEVSVGQYTEISTVDGMLDVSQLTKVHISPGWHTVVTTAEPESADDRFYSVNENRYLQDLVYQMYAFLQPLQETSWFELKYNTLMTDHTKYAIEDYEGYGNKSIIVNYRPQVTPWASTSDDLLCPSGPEVYVLSYKFITLETNNIYFKAVFSRDPNTAAPTATPSLRSYTIKLGY
jgi:hypothetical protein